MTHSATMRFTIIFFTIMLMYIIGSSYADSSTDDNALNDYSDYISYYDDDDDSQNSKNDQDYSTPEECARTCVSGEKPKTCYYHFSVENYATLTRACDLCRTNVTRLTADCQCITADGFEISGIKVVNRMYPGPSIMVCLNDYVVIDVENRVHGNAITIHWHGIFQEGYQYYDGVPYVTQCPIQEGTTFRYQWRAKNSGTHFWHSHSGLQKMDGLDGAIIVREPKNEEINSNLWDYDNLDNIIFITDWFHDSAESHFPGNYIRNTLQLPDNYLINGMGQWTDPVTQTTTTTPLATFTVEKGRRYRFRLINSCNLNCPAQMTIQGHRMTVIASDGEPLKPVVVDSITSFSAERYDFVLHTDQVPGTYWIQVRGLAECSSRQTQQLAIIRYKTSTVDMPQQPRPTYLQGLQAGIVLNQVNVRCDGSSNSRNVVCISQLENARNVPSRVLTQTPDIKLYMPFGFYNYKLTEVFKPGVYRDFIVPTKSGEIVALIGKNITNALPPVALISQRDELADEQICTLENVPSRCVQGKPCKCSIVEEIPLNSVVEIVLVDTDHVMGLSHPFHLHGGVFYIVGEGRGATHDMSRMDLETIKRLDESGQLKRNLTQPPAKDTYAVVNYGYSIIRFLADNPGYWFFHCHFVFHLATGMSAVFHVGDQNDLPPVPDNFPECGNFLPSIDNNS